MKNNEFQIVDVHEYRCGLEAATCYIHSKWGNEQNLNYYRDAICHYGAKLPRFFLLCKGQEIVGCGALLRHDFTSRQDLYPWYGCHYIEETYRGNGLGNMLLRHGIRLAAEAGYSTVYLCTDLEAYYEKYGWERTKDAYEPNGKKARVYCYRIR